MLVLAQPVAALQISFTSAGIGEQEEEEEEPAIVRNGCTQVVGHHQMRQPALVGCSGGFLAAAMLNYSIFAVPMLPAWLLSSSIIVVAVLLDAGNQCSLVGQSVSQTVIRGGGGATNASLSAGRRKKGWT